MGTAGVHQVCGYLAVNDAGVALQQATDCSLLVIWQVLMQLHLRGMRHSSRRRPSQALDLATSSVWATVAWASTRTPRW